MRSMQRSMPQGKGYSMLVVLDTNILVSGLMSPNGKPARLLDRVMNGDDTLCVDDGILWEYRVVLFRPKFGFDPDAVESLLSYLRSHSLIVTPDASEVPFTDESDRKFYEVAKYCNATLVTGNLKHFPNDPIVKGVQEI